MSNVCIHKHTHISVFSLPWNLNYLKENLQWMHSNHTSHLLFTSTFYSFKSDLFLIPKVLDSNRLSMKIPTEKVMYTQGEKAKPSLPSPPIQLKEMQNPFQTEKDWLIPQSFLKATLGTSQCFHTVCALFSPQLLGVSRGKKLEAPCSSEERTLPHILVTTSLMHCQLLLLLLGFSCWVFCMVFLFGLSSVLNFTIQKYYSAQALKKSPLLLRQFALMERSSSTTTS